VRRSRPFWAKAIGATVRPSAAGFFRGPAPAGCSTSGCGAGSYLKTMADQGWGRDRRSMRPRRAVGQAQRAVRAEPRWSAPFRTRDLRPGIVRCDYDCGTRSNTSTARSNCCAKRSGFWCRAGNSSSQRRTSRACLTACFGRSWFGLDLPRHLTHFTPATMTAMVSSGRLPRGADSPSASQRLGCARGARRAEARRSRAGLLTKVLRWKPAARLAGWVCYAASASDCHRVRRRTTRIISDGVETLPSDILTCTNVPRGTSGVLWGKPPRRRLSK